MVFLPHSLLEPLLRVCLGRKKKRRWVPLHVKAVIDSNHPKPTATTSPYTGRAAAAWSTTATKQTSPEATPAIPCPSGVWPVAPSQIEASRFRCHLDTLPLPMAPTHTPTHCPLPVRVFPGTLPSIPSLINQRHEWALPAHPCRLRYGRLQAMGFPTLLALTLVRLVSETQPHSSTPRAP